MQPDSQGQITVAVKNCSPIYLEVQPNDFISSVENVQDCKTREVNLAYLQAIAQQKENTRPRQNLSAKKRQFIEENVNLQVPEQFWQKYLNLLLKNYRPLAKISLILAAPTL